MQTKGIGVRVSQLGTVLISTSLEMGFSFLKIHKGLLYVGSMILINLIKWVVYIYQLYCHKYVLIRRRVMQHGHACMVCTLQQRLWNN